MLNIVEEILQEKIKQNIQMHRGINQEILLIVVKFHFWQDYQIKSKK